MVFSLWTLAPHALANSDDVSSQAHFEAGVAAYRKGETKKAQHEFKAALSGDEQNPASLNNLALTFQKDGRHGLALALWRKALAIRPDFHPALSGIRSSEAKLEHKTIPHEVEFFEYLRESMLIGVPLERYLFLTAMGLVTSCWLLLKYFGLRRRALLDDKPLPSFPWLGALTSLVFLACATLTAAKLIDLSIIRGTIITSKVEARSSPDSSATSLFDLYEGLEVIIRQTSDDWTQVNYPGGATGWIPRSAVFATNDPATEKVSP